MSKRTDKQLILDIDSTLICQVEVSKLRHDSDNVKYAICVDPKDVTPAGTGDEYNFGVALRPHLKEFILWALEYFDKVHVWSAGQKHYVLTVSSIIFQDILEEEYGGIVDTLDYVDRVMSYEECDIDVDKSGKHVGIIKDMKRKGFDMSKTIILDDTKNTFRLNKSNAILIPAFEINDEKELRDYSKGLVHRNDDALIKIMNFFERSNVINCKDVRKIEKSNIFN